MVDIATRVYNHKWKIDPIVRSLIDTDFYKLLMCQSIFRNRRDTQVTFSLINRSEERRVGKECKFRWPPAPGNQQTILQTHAATRVLIRVAPSTSAYNTDSIQ